MKISLQYQFKEIPSRDIEIFKRVSQSFLVVSNGLYSDYCEFFIQEKSRNNWEFVSMEKEIKYLMKD